MVESTLIRSSDQQPIKKVRMILCGKPPADTHIYEAARELKAAGVGINLQPHAVFILPNLRLLKALEEQGIKPLK
jgi:2-polyprenyl-6-methoxyphenol hydroxylase-like FAD-dependent oxidoreductase